MRYRTEAQLSTIAAAVLPGARIVSSGNFAIPFHVLGVIDKSLETYRLNLLNAQPGIPDREGVTYETSFVGPAMRRSPRLNYSPARLSLLPRLFQTTLPPDAVVITTSTPHDGMVSLGTEVNVLPAALEAVRRRGGIVIAEINRHVPYTFGDALVPTDLIDYAIDVAAPLPSPSTTPRTRPHSRSGSRSRRESRMAPRCSSGSARSRTQLCAGSQGARASGSGVR
jgi:hypothetical protein